MEIKKWNEYTNEEKSCLLLHWWHYYGKLLYTFAELEQFEALVRENPDRIFHIAVMSYYFNFGSQILLESMRRKQLDGLFATIPDYENADDSFKKINEGIENSFINEIVTTYNNPEQNALMAVDIVVMRLDK